MARKSRRGDGVTVSFGAKFAQSDQFRTVFREGMALVEAAATYLDGDGRKESRKLQPPHSLAYATESMRLTTRLMQLASWLLIRRAVSEGELTLEQETAVVADRKLMLLAICCLRQWTFEQMVATYSISDAECVRYLLQLDKLGFIELRPLNRYRLKVGKGFRWRPHGPAMAYFREHVAADYYSGGFDGEGETLMLVHGHIGTAQAVNFVLSYAMVTVGFAFIYKLMPRVRVAWRDVWIGAAVTALLFTVGKHLIGLYIGTSSVASGFGAAGSLVVVLVWVYYSAQIFLLGAEFTWVYAHSHGSMRGTERPAPALP